MTLGIIVKFGNPRLALLAFLSFGALDCGGGRPEPVEGDAAKTPATTDPRESESEDTEDSASEGPLGTGTEEE